ncbi:MAG: hypothetical protein HQ555_02335 [Candidatus Aminicenantes bacterium]|nr:hypothetical protein [Candidatus Aminicenantes bacterium]
MKNKIFILTLIIILFTGCSELTRAYHVKTYIDEFENYEEYQQKYNRNDFLSFMKMDALDLRIRKYSDGTKVYCIIVYVERSEWFFIQQVSLEIKADNRIFKFPFLAQKSNVFSTNKVREWGYYKADIESINKIMEAEKVVGKLYGHNGFIVIEYHSVVFERWRKFLEEYDK